MTDADNIKLPAKQVRQRFGVSDMSIYRWLRDEKLHFPKPIIINRRRYWALDEIVAWERSRSPSVPA